MSGQPGARGGDLRGRRQGSARRYVHHSCSRGWLGILLSGPLGGGRRQLGCAGAPALGAFPTTQPFGGLLHQAPFLLHLGLE